MAAPDQSCSVPGCEHLAAFKTRSKPTWCDEHVTGFLRDGGLEPLEPLVKPTAWRLTRCLSCGCEAHYRLVYTLEKNEIGEKTCRACYWRAWAAQTRRLQGSYANVSVTPPEAARQYAEANDFQYLEALTSPSLADDPHRVQCTRCGRISAERLTDIGWGCSCRRNTGPAPATPTKTKSLLRDSGLEATRWWDASANDPALWATISPRARREAAWVCPECDHRFTARVMDMAEAAKCPRCEAIRQAHWDAEYARYKQTPVSEVAELLAAWADDADPATVMVGGDWVLRVFRCAQGHRPRMQPLTFLTQGCPVCRGLETRRRRERAAEAAVRSGEIDEVQARWAMLSRQLDDDRINYYVRDMPSATDEDYDARVEELAELEAAHTELRQATAELVDHDPMLRSAGLGAELLGQWHPTLNGALTPAKISPTSRRGIWWREPSCGHEWRATPADRQKGRRPRCPECDTILDSLAFHRPDLAAEWSPTNPRNAWQVRPSGSTPFTPLWVCAKEPEHTWAATLASRAAGSGCPECRESGKSRVELDHLAAASAMFGRASSGIVLRDRAFLRRGTWTVDITVELDDGQLLVVEYDGSYWHADKADIDTAKSLDLLASGRVVARLREHPLPPLAIEDDRYREFTVYAVAPDPGRVMREVARWVRTLR